MNGFVNTDTNLNLDQVRIIYQNTIAFFQRSQTTSSDRGMRVSRSFDAQIMHSLQCMLADFRKKLTTSCKLMAVLNSLMLHPAYEAKIYKSWFIDFSDNFSLSCFRLKVTFSFGFPDFPHFMRITEKTIVTIENMGNIQFPGKEIRRI